MFKVKNLFWFIPLLALITLPLWYPHIAEFLRPTVTVYTPRVAEGPDQSLTLTGLTFFQSSGGRQEWRIKASSMYSENGEKNMQLVNVLADFFGKQAAEGEPGGTTNIRSGKARYEKDRQLLTLKDNVVVTTTSGYEMHADVLYYQEDLHRLHATSGVRITGRGLLLTGREMTYDPERHYLQVDGQVAAEVY
jgi:LPS export ABC transporter protein LptC